MAPAAAKVDEVEETQAMSPGCEVRRIGEEVPYYVLIYEVVDDYVARRAPYREENLRLAREAHRRSELLLGGALSDPADRALLVFRASDKAVVEEFVRNDPYFIHRLVTRWEIRNWAVVIGTEDVAGAP
jgi:uncharacterized protein